MANVFTQAADMLARYAEQHERIIVGYSGGKDSLATLDLCVKAFGAKRVVCYYGYFIPNLAVIQTQLDFAIQRYGVEILQYPRFSVLAALREGIYCKSHHSLDDMPDFGPFDMSDLVMLDTGIDLCAMGFKKSDGQARRHLVTNIKESRPNLIFPVLEWNKYEVLAYLRVNNIPIPPSYGALTTGINVNANSLLWLHDNHPDDFKKLLRWFPFARAVLYRRKWYGIEG